MRIEDQTVEILLLKVHVIIKPHFCNCFFAWKREAHPYARRRFLSLRFSAARVAEKTASSSSSTTTPRVREEEETKSMRHRQHYRDKNDRITPLRVLRTHENPEHRVHGNVPRTGGVHLCASPRDANAVEARVYACAERFSPSHARVWGNLSRHATSGGREVRGAFVEEGRGGGRRSRE